MGTRHVFSGSAVATVAPDGLVELPAFVRRAFEADTADRRLVVGAHDSDPCLTAYDAAHMPAVHDELERRRLRDEGLGEGPEAHHHRARRAFGFAENAPLDDGGRFVLPELMRRRGRIDDLVLFVGAGAQVELWNPSLARASGDEDLRELAEYRLEEIGRERRR